MYVSRPEEEEEVRRRLAKREPIVIAGPWQIGKSAFFKHVLRVLIRKHDDEVGRESKLIVIRVPEIVADCRDDGQFLRRLLDAIGDQALVAQERMLPEDLSKPARLRLLMKSELERRERIVLALEGAGALAKLDPSSREWFVSSMKSWADTWDEPWHKLQMVMELTTSPEVLDRDVAVSPWNVNVVRLGGFNATQSAKLASLYGLDWSVPQIEKCLATDFGGYPALLRAIMERAVGAGKPPIASFALGDPPRIHANHPVRPLLEKLYAMTEQRPELLNQLYRLLDHGRRATIAQGDNALPTDKLLQRLLATGLIKLDHASDSGGRQFSFGCRAYAAYFRERMFPSAMMMV